MSNLVKTGTLLSVIFSLTGCSSIGVLEPNSAINKEKESIFVIGVNPDNYKITIFPGSISDNSYKQSIWQSATVSSHPDEGYVVSKAAKDAVLGLTSIRVTAKKGDIYGTNYGACEGQSTITFRVPSGKVLYLGDIYYKPTVSGLTMNVLDNIEQARIYVNAKYPQYADRLEKWPFEIATVNKSCTTTYYIYY